MTLPAEDVRNPREVHGRITPINVPPPTLSEQGRHAPADTSLNVDNPFSVGEGRRRRSIVPQSSPPQPYPSARDAVVEPLSR